MLTKIDFNRVFKILLFLEFLKLQRLHGIFYVANVSFWWVKCFRATLAMDLEAKDLGFVMEDFRG